MPSALETLVKILKLEKEQGCKNKAVVGGFSAYSDNWEPQAREQAEGKPKRQILIDELTILLKRYEQVKMTTERFEQVNYMLDRIMGRVAAPPEYQKQLTTQPVPSKPRQIAKPRESQQKPPKPEAVKPRRHQKERRKSSKPDRQPAEDKRRSFQDISRAYDLRPVAPREMDVYPLPTLARPPRKPRAHVAFEETARALQALNKSVMNVKGIGEKMAENLTQIGIHTINDMLYYLPRRYDDYTQFTYISRLQPEQVVTIIGTVVRTQVVVGKNNRRDFVLVLDDGSDTLSVRFFAQHYMVRMIKVGQQIVLSGKTTLFRDTVQLSNPEWEFLDSENLHTTGIVPVYRLAEGLKPRSFRKQMKRVIDDWADRIPDFIPETVLERSELADIGWAIKNLHFPEGRDHLEHARKRIVFDELITLQLGVLQNRREWQSIPGQALEVEDRFLETFLGSVFPYQLTGAQQRAIADIRRDVALDIPMNRLIQGDVGSGKTAIAIVAMAMAFSNRKQAALMAPTSILAEQHYRNISETLANILDDFKPVIALLTSALTTTERQSIYRGLADGSIDVVIGTHALIQGGVEFNDLALAVVDEQHRFGVEQRGALRGKGTNPHLLVMTATPIPRTMALTMYADLDLTIIDEKPPGRQPVETKVIQPVARERVNGFIEAQLEQGRQAFVVHPLVEESDNIDARSATEAYHQLKQVFYKYRVCLLHGRMNPTEKDMIMAAFANHEYDVMVTTSVAEVGVDVPNASVIVIEGANRFGLAQLHQFRGRVGRGQHPSFCLLVPDNDTPESEERLEAMVSTNDGFRLAEMDWQLRGAGDLLGTRQSGKHQLRLVEQMSPQLVELAQREARTIYHDDPEMSQPQHRLLMERVAMLQNNAGDIS